MFCDDRHDPATTSVTVARGEAGGAFDGDVVALGGAGSEHDLPRFGAEQRGNMATRGFDGGLGGAAHDVLDAVRVAVLLGEPGQHRGDDSWVAAGGGLVVQVDRPVRVDWMIVHTHILWGHAAVGTRAGFIRTAMRA